jgi:hypothetical protein
VLLMHHEKDGCSNATPSNTQRLYTKLKESGNAAAEFVAISTGEAEPRDVCLSGYHMYFGAADEVAKVMDQFMTKHITPR